MRRGVGAALAAVIAGGACELDEITVVEVEDVVVAEVYVNLAADPADHEVRAYLHRTLGAAEEGVLALSSASVTIRRTDGFTISLLSQNPDFCVDSSPEEPDGGCFIADPAAARNLTPGDVLELEIVLADGGRMSGAVRVPRSFELDGIQPTCRLDPNRLMPLRWSRSEGAAAYVNETTIRGLPAALEPEGIESDDDPLYLLGLSVSDADTTIVFPSEFGVFNRFELDQDLAVRLQSGLPPQTSAEITITAVDQNFVNWARGGTFNPSGQVRVPSLRGDGTGVFAATVVRRFTLISSSATPGVPDCPILDPR